MTDALAYYGSYNKVKFAALETGTPQIYGGERKKDV